MSNTLNPLTPSELISTLRGTSSTVDGVTHRTQTIDGYTLHEYIEGTRHEFEITHDFNRRVGLDITQVPNFDGGFIVHEVRVNASAGGIGTPEEAMEFAEEVQKVGLIGQMFQNYILGR